MGPLDRDDNARGSMERSRPGTGEVHAHISAQPAKGIGMSGKFESADRDSAARSARDRAEDALDSARERSSGLLGRVTSLARDNPMAAVGVAFAVGFLLAGDGDEEESRHPALLRVKNQVKGAILGGISAAVSQQMRSFIKEQGGISGLLGTLGVHMPERGWGDGEADDYEEAYDEM